MKRILVTGASRGLGLALSERLLSEGHSLVVASRTVSPELAALILRYEDRIEHHAVDFAKPGSAGWLARAARLVEGIDGFVANAATAPDGLLTLMPEAVLRECVEVNLVAVMLLTREVVKGMIERGGSLVFVSSIGARAGLTGLTAYCATKGALVSFSRAIAREYGERGVRSNCVLPGFLETEMTSRLSPGDKKRLARRAALKRLGCPADVVGVVSFLLSDEARFISGTEVVVDGGLLA